MCVFIIVAVRKFSGDPAEVFTRRRLWVSSYGVDVPRVRFSSDAVRMNVSDGHCACSIYAGYASEPEPEAEDAGDAIRETYRRKGWTETKIDRALASKRHARKMRPEFQRGTSFAAAVAELVESGARVELIASDSNAEFNVSGAMKLPLATFVASGGQFPENTCVSITAAGRDIIASARDRPR